MACIKAFTVLAKFNNTIAINVTGNRIIVSVLDQYSNPVRDGKINFTLGGETQTLNLIGGEVEVPFKLKDGVYNLTVDYESDDYNGSQNNLTLDISLDIILSSNKIICIQFKLQDSSKRPVFKSDCRQGIANKQCKDD